MAEYSLAELAELLGAKTQGNHDIVVTQLAPLHQAMAGQLSFLQNSKYKKYLQDTQASAVIIHEDYAAECPVAALIVDNPYYAYAKLSQLFEVAPKRLPSIDKTAIVAATATIAASAHIGAHVVIGEDVIIEDGVVIEANTSISDDARIGADTHIWPNVTIYHGVNIGKRGRIHSGVVLGADGFGIAMHQGQWHNIAQIGGLNIGDDVSIGANSSIDRGALGDTVIAAGVKLDNQIQIGHNVQIGKHTAIAGCTAIAGSTKIGAYCLIGGGVCIAGHIEITDKVIITGMAGIAHTITESGVYSSGVKAQPTAQWAKNATRFLHLDSLFRRFSSLEKRVNSLKEEKQS